MRLVSEYAGEKKESLSLLDNWGNVKHEQCLRSLGVSIGESGTQVSSPNSKSLHHGMGQVGDMMCNSL